MLLTDPANIAFMEKALEKEKAEGRAALAPTTNNVSFNTTRRRAAPDPNTPTAKET